MWIETSRSSTFKFQRICKEDLIERREKNEETVAEVKMKSVSRSGQEHKVLKIG